LIKKMSFFSWQSEAYSVCWGLEWWMLGDYSIQLDRYDWTFVLQEQSSTSAFSTPRS